MQLIRLQMITLPQYTSPGPKPFEPPLCQL